MTVFFDRTFGRRLPEALKALGADVEHHADHFVHNAPDDFWLAEVGSRGWFVLTNDKRIRSRPAERHALISHGVGCFALGSGSLSRWDQATILLRSWRRMEGLMQTLPRPFIVLVHANGRLEQLYPAKAELAPAEPN